MVEVALSSAVGAVESVEATVQRGEVPVAMTQMPLPDGVGLVPGLPQSFWQQFVSKRCPAKVDSLDPSDLHAQFERVPVTVS